MEVGDPVRERIIPNRCVCVIYRSEQDYDWCSNETTGPDDPWCSHCDDRHPQITIAVVTTVMELVKEGVTLG